MLFNGRTLIFTFSRTQVRIAEHERLQSLIKTSMGYPQSPTQDSDPVGQTGGRGRVRGGLGGVTHHVSGDGGLRWGYPQSATQDSDPVGQTRSEGGRRVGGGVGMGVRGDPPCSRWLGPPVGLSSVRDSGFRPSWTDEIRATAASCIHATAGIGQKWIYNKNNGIIAPVMFHPTIVPRSGLELATSRPRSFIVAEVSHARNHSAMEAAAI